MALSLRHYLEEMGQHKALQVRRVLHHYYRVHREEMGTSSQTSFFCNMVLTRTPPTRRTLTATSLQQHVAVTTRTEKRTATAMTGSNRNKRSMVVQPSGAR